jgi:hypothetical protein
VLGKILNLTFSLGYIVSFHFIITQIPFLEDYPTLNIPRYEEIGPKTKPNKETSRTILDGERYPDV